MGASLIGPIIGGVGSIAGGLIGSSGAQSAADTQAAAAGQAAQVQWNMFQQDQQDLQPYMNTGVAGNNALLTALGIGSSGSGTPSSLLTGPVMDEATLQQTPGYQFTQTQGLKATQNAAAARGLGVSGAALKGAATYATGLADNTYQQQYQNAVTNQTNEFNRLLGITQLGQSSAAGVGAQGIQTGANIANTTVGSANAQAASTIAGTNAISNGISTAALLPMLQSMYGNSGN